MSLFAPSFAYPEARCARRRHAVMPGRGHASYLSQAQKYTYMCPCFLRSFFDLVIISPWSNTLLTGALLIAVPHVIQVCLCDIHLYQNECVWFVWVVLHFEPLRVQVFERLVGCLV